MFLCVCFPVKVSHFTMFLSKLQEGSLRDELLFVNSTCNLHTHKKNIVELLAIIGTNRLFARF